MRIPFALLALVAVAAALAAPAGAKTAIPIVIKHQTHGCHSWSVANGAFYPAHTIRVHAGTTFSVTNNDVMPHTLVQLAGPHVTLTSSQMGHLTSLRMGHMGASATFTLTKRGTYRFMTKAGEDYPGVTVKTTGADNVLRLMVVVV